MSYRYNAETDRLSCIYNPSFIKAVYTDKKLGKMRELPLWVTTSNARAALTTAKNFRNEGEILNSVSLMSEKSFLNWLCQGIEIIDPTTNQKIPDNFICKFLIACDQPCSNPSLNKGKYGNLSSYRNLLQQDEGFMQKLLKSLLLKSFQLAKPENDIVREEEIIPSNSSGYQDTLFSSYLQRIEREDSGELEIEH